MSGLGLDPGLSRGASPVLYATCLKLVNYRPGGGLVPEAAPWPRISRDGRTYTFVVKPRFTRFSNGERVGPASFARAIHRLTDPRIGSPGVRFIEDVVGVFEVRQGIVRTIRGVRVRGSRLTIQLRRRAHDFLARLAIPHFCSIASTDPARPHEPVESIAAAGPYYAASVDGRRVVLRQNRYYKGPRRRGPTRIELLAPTRGSALARVESGAIDVVHEPNLERGETPRTARMRSVPLPSILALVFNEPPGRPFANLRLRQAAALALDRLGTARGLGRETDALALSSSLGLRRVGAYPPRPTEQNRARARELARGLVPVAVAGRNTQDS
jgi:ABC-type oligopeptide transport system substrate-binding subunit